MCAFLLPVPLYSKIDLLAQLLACLPLQQQSKVEGLLHLNDQGLALIRPKSHQITVPHLTLHLIALFLEKKF
ncbi:hypothetical protein D3C81_1162760 [compost metagenome]